MSTPYPDREMDPLTTLLRLFTVFTVIPIAVVLGLVMGPSADSNSGHHHVLAAGGFVSAATALMLVFRRKYPRWWFDWSLALARFGTRVTAYLALLRDEYPRPMRSRRSTWRSPYPDAARAVLESSASSGHWCS